MKAWSRAGFRIIFPGRIPYTGEMTKYYGIPEEAEMGGAQTMYPEFRDKIKDKFKLPAKCTLNCGGGRGN